MPDPDLSRRRALTGAIALGVGVPVLAACGANGSSTAGQGTPSGTKPAGGGSSTGGSSSGSTAGLVATTDVPVGGGVLLKDQNLVVTQPKRGEFKAFTATCTHAGCQVAGVSQGVIACPCHGSQFSITDGANVAGPSGSPAGSVAPLTAKPVSVKGTEVVEG